MAYNKKNYWLLIIDIQELVLKLQDEHLDIRLKRIHKDFVYPKYKITYRTLSTYLGVPAKRELKKYLEIENTQTKLDL
jgi:hypothetical protein